MWCVPECDKMKNQKPSTPTVNKYVEERRTTKIQSSRICPCYYRTFHLINKTRLPPKLPLTSATSNVRLAGHQCSVVKWHKNYAKRKMLVIFLCPSKFPLAAATNSFRLPRLEPHDGMAAVFTQWCAREYSK
jgi:hypothetical protein